MRTTWVLAGVVALAFSWIAGPHVFRMASETVGTESSKFPPLIDYVDPHKDQLQSVTESALVTEEPRPLDQTNCFLPRPQPGAQVVAFRLKGQPQTASTIALYSPDVSTGVVDVVVEDGREPLYVILSAEHATIWRLKGDVSRVQRLVLMARSPTWTLRWHCSPPKICENPQLPPGPTHSAAIGIDAYRTSIADAYSCRAGFSALQAALGRTPDVMAEWEDLTAVSLPSGQVTWERPISPAAYPSARFAGGLSEIDPEGLIGSVPGVRYDTLPGVIGWEQLRRAGATHYRHDDFASPNPLASLWIWRPIARLPAGEHYDTVKLAVGVPVPAGLDFSALCVRRQMVMGLRWTYPLTEGCGAAASRNEV